MSTFQPETETYTPGEQPEVATPENEKPTGRRGAVAKNNQ